MSDDPTRDDAAEDKNLHDPQKTPPAISDEESFSGDTPALTSDDDVDELGEEYGVNYEDKEELDMSKKIKMQTETEPPVKEE